MTENNSERRKSARVYLKPDIATALLKSEKSSGEIFAKILNVSEGGFGLGIQRDQGLDICPGDNLVIKDIVGRKELRNEKKIIISVQWILDYKGMGSLGAGCAFIEVDPGYQDKITKFIKENII